jgi:selenocysteine lyase/cysteine desulfurase
MGAFPIDVRAAGIHALAADGHKWMLGPEGNGILYIQMDVQDQIDPVEFGWTNTANYADYASRDLTLRPDAGRYECGTLNTVGCYGLRAALDFLTEVGIDRVGAHVQSLSDRAAQGVQEKGYELATPRTDATGAGIVSFRRNGTDSRQVVRLLKHQKIITAPRQGWVRLAPHFYISEDEIDQLVAALP